MKRGPQEIVVAGRRFQVPGAARIVTFLDPGGYSFYERTAPQFQPIRAPNEDNVEVPLVRPRRLPNGAPAGLGGVGWDVGGADPIANLRKVVHTVVLHHDASLSVKGCYRTLIGRGLSTHFMVERDGTTYQCVDVADMAIHAAGMNRMSVGIDLNNPADDLIQHPDLVREGFEPSKKMEINGVLHQSWKYTDEQYEALISLLRVLVDVLGIEPVFPVGEDGKILPYVLQSPPPQQFHGIQCHWHSSAEKFDPGPGFDWERVQAALRRENATLAVVPHLPQSAWRRIGAIPSVGDERDVVEKALETESTGTRAADIICEHIEQQAKGGYFPIGLNQTWHNGIHIRVPEGAMVRPILPGELVAAHLVPEDRFSELGSNNFILLRHTIRLPKRFREKPKQRQQGPGPQEQEPQQDTLVVFSLYMHLAGVDLKSPPDTPFFRKVLSRDIPGETISHEAKPYLPLQALPQAKNQVDALRKGFIGLFSPPDKPEESVKLSPTEDMWRVGEFGQDEMRHKVLHLEVFSDDSFLEVMDLGLYGKFLQLGPSEPESHDLRVRNWQILAAFWDPGMQRLGKRREPIATGRLLRPGDIEAFYEASDPDILKIRKIFRRLIVRHVSEWSDQVKWAKVLFRNQDEQHWKNKVSGKHGEGLFVSEVAKYLPFIWLNSDVARHMGVDYNDGVFAFFHPIYFVLWWLYRRSAARGKSLEALLREVRGNVELMRKGLTRPLDELLETPVDGEWS